MQASDEVDYMLITVTHNDESYGTVECAYQMKLVEIVADIMDIPNQDVHSQYKLSVNTLKKWKDLLFSNCPITFTPKEVGLIIESEDDMKHKLKLNDQQSPYRNHPHQDVYLLM